MSRELSATVKVISGPVSTTPVNRHLFGKFTEHLGRNVYGGAWAQILANPDFAPIEQWPNRGQLLGRLQGASVSGGLLHLASQAATGMPPWWATEGHLATEYGADRGKGTLTLMTQDASGGCLVTPMYLPVHRTPQYQLSLHMRGTCRVQISVRAAGSGAILATTSVQAGADWSICQALLHLQGNPKPGEPYHLMLQPEAGVIQLRQCLLFPADHVDGWDPDVVRLMREARLPLLRFPGGNFVSDYHWENGVGPLADRPVLPNPAWPEVEWNHVGTDEWLRLCELVGCEALICVNAGTGTPEEAARWVEYCNGASDSPLGARRALNGHPTPFGVRLWEVGNELYGSWQAGHTDALGYAQRYGEYAEAMLRADPEIKLIANGDTEPWNRTVTFANTSRVRSLSHHCLYSGYPDDADPERVYLEHMAFTPAYAQMWQELIRPMREAAIEPVLAITEQQVFTHKPYLPNNATLTEALWTASIINEAIRSDGLIELITHSALINHGGGMRKEREVVYAQPVWWTTHLYSTAPYPLHRVELAVDSPTFSAQPYRLRTVEAAYLDAVGLTSPNEQEYVLFLVNRHPDRALDLSLHLPEKQYRSIETCLLTGDSYMAANSYQHPEKVTPLTGLETWQPTNGCVYQAQLPPLSLVRLWVR